MSRTDPLQLSDSANYKLFYDEHVRFADLDVLGHVNNNAYGVYYEGARIALLDACRRDFFKSGYLLVLAHLAIDYWAEVTRPADLKVGIRIIKIGTSSVTMGSAIFHNGVCVSTSQSVGVIVDRQTRRPIPIPPELRVAMAHYADPPYDQVSA